MNRLFGHLRNVIRHRRLVRRYCFRLGLYRQGLTHDLSKYSLTEFRLGVRYYQGDSSPNFAERRQNGKGYSECWLHHKGRNRHHADYWLDYVLQPDGTFVFGPCPMPMKYLAEMFCDRVAANRIYRGDAYTDAAPYEYFRDTREGLPLHPDSDAEMEKMLLILRDEGEEAAFSYVRKRLKDEKTRRTP